MTTYDKTSDSKVTAANTNCVDRRYKSQSMLYAQTSALRSIHD